MNIFARMRRADQSSHQLPWIEHARRIHLALDRAKQTHPLRALLGAKPGHVVLTDTVVMRDRAADPHDRV